MIFSRDIIANISSETPEYRVRCPLSKYTSNFLQGIFAAEIIELTIFLLTTFFQVVNNVIYPVFSVPNKFCENWNIYFRRGQKGLSSCMSFKKTVLLVREKYQLTIVCLIRNRNWKINKIERNTVGKPCLSYSLNCT